MAINEENEEIYGGKGYKEERKKFLRVKKELDINKGLVEAWKNNGDEEAKLKIQEELYRSEKLFDFVWSQWRDKLNRSHNVEPFDLLNDAIEEMLNNLRIKLSFSMDAKFENDLNKGTVSDELKNLFKTKKYRLSENASVTKKDDEWVITEEEREFIVRKEGEKLNVYTYFKYQGNKELISGVEGIIHWRVLDILKSEKWKIEEMKRFLFEIIKFGGKRKPGEEEETTLGELIPAPEEGPLEEEIPENIKELRQKHKLSSEVCELLDTCWEIYREPRPGLPGDHELSQELREQLGISPATLSRRCKPLKEAAYVFYFEENHKPETRFEIQLLCWLFTPQELERILKRKKGMKDF